jgi:hypothetical protein
LVAASTCYAAIRMDRGAMDVPSNTLCPKNRDRFFVTNVCIDVFVSFQGDLPYPEHEQPRTVAVTIL